MREIAEAKKPDLNANDVEAAMKIVAGTARSMGVEVAGCVSTASVSARCRRAYDAAQLYAPLEATQIVKRNANAKFNETVEIHIKLGVDPKKSDQNVRGTVNLPHGTGRTVRVIAFARGDAAKAAEAAGADIVGEADLIERVKAGFTDFDVAVATPDMMPAIGKELGRILAQKMPNPKAGTVSPNIANAVRDIKAGKVEYRLDKTGIVHTIVGKASFDENADHREPRRAARRDRAREAVGREGHVSEVDHADLDDGSRREGRPDPHQGLRRQRIAHRAKQQEGAARDVPRLFLSSARADQLDGGFERVDDRRALRQPGDAQQPYHALVARDHHELAVERARAPFGAEELLDRRRVDIVHAGEVDDQARVVAHFLEGHVHVVPRGDVVLAFEPHDRRISAFAHVSSPLRRRRSPRIRGEPRRSTVVRSKPARSAERSAALAADRFERRSRGTARGTELGARAQQRAMDAAAAKLRQHGAGEEVGDLAGDADRARAGRRRRRPRR